MKINKILNYIKNLTLSGFNKLKGLFKKTNTINLRCFLCGNSFKGDMGQVKEFTELVNNGTPVEEIVKKIPIKCPKCKSPQWVITSRGKMIILTDKITNFIGDIIGAIAARLYLRVLVFRVNWGYEIRATVTRGLPMLLLLIIPIYLKSYIFSTEPLHLLYIYIIASYLAVNLSIKWRT